MNEQDFQNAADLIKGDTKAMEQLQQGIVNAKSGGIVNQNKVVTAFNKAYQTSLENKYITKEFDFNNLQTWMGDNMTEQQLQEFEETTKEIASNSPVLYQLQFDIDRAKNTNNQNVVGKNEAIAAFENARQQIRNNYLDNLYKNIPESGLARTIYEAQNEVYGNEAGMNDAQIQDFTEDIMQSYTRGGNAGWNFQFNIYDAQNEPTPSAIKKGLKKAFDQARIELDIEDPNNQTGTTQVQVARQNIPQDAPPALKTLPTKPLNHLIAAALTAVTVGAAAIAAKRKINAEQKYENERKQCIQEQKARKTTPAPAPAPAPAAQETQAEDKSVETRLERVRRNYGYLLYQQSKQALNRPTGFKEIDQARRIQAVLHDLMRVAKSFKQRLMVDSDLFNLTARRKAIKRFRQKLSAQLNGMASSIRGLKAYKRSIDGRVSALRLFLAGLE